MPQLSILVPVYKANAQHLRESIASLRVSAPLDSEILLGLDGPCTREISETIDQLQTIKAGPAIRVMSLAKRGLAGTLNTLLDGSDSQWIARQDADDISLPNRFSMQLEAMASKPGTAFCGTQICRCDSEMRPFRVQRSYPKTHKGQLLYSCCVNNPIAHPSLLLSRERLGGIRYEEVEGAEDWNLYIRLWGQGLKSLNLSTYGLLYRVHANQATAKVRSKAIINRMKRKTVQSIRESGRETWQYEMLRRISKITGLTEMGLTMKQVREYRQ